jgi:hypothetical protein
MKSFIEKYKKLVEEMARTNDEDIKYYMGEDIKKSSRDRFKNTIFSIYEVVKAQNPNIPDPHPSADEYGYLNLRYSKGDGKNLIDIEFETDDNIVLTTRAFEKSTSKDIQSNDDVIKEVLDWWKCLMQKHL